MIPSVRVPGQSPPVTQVEFLRAGAGVTRSDSDEGLQQRELWSQIRYRDHTEIPILWNVITVYVTFSRFIMLHTKQDTKCRSFTLPFKDFCMFSLMLNKAEFI